MSTANVAALELSKVLAAPVAEVYKAWTDPATLRKWFGRPGSLLVECTADVRVGGMYAMVFRSGKGEHHPGIKDGQARVMGVYREVEPNRRLVYTWETEGTVEDVRGTLVTVEFAAVDERSTQVRLRHEQMPTGTAREQHSAGWRMCVESLEKHHAVEALEREIQESKKRLAALRKSAGAVAVAEYTLKTLEGAPVRLEELFAGKDELIVIHNMGKKCVYCTLWADGVNGVHQHLSDRAGFVVVTPDEPGVAREFAASRGWGFRMASAAGSTFTRDMGYEPEPGRHWPGASSFRKGDDGVVRRVACTHFGPGDDFCAVWHLLALLDRGEAGWAPKYAY